MLEQKISDAFMAAYKAKEEARVGVMRMLKSAILNKKIEKRLAKEDVLPDEEAITVLSGEVKKRLDSAEAYAAGGRQELADAELAEAEIIKEFLPAQLSEDQIREIVAGIIAEQGNPGASGFGKIMGAASAKTKGAADGAVVSRIVKEELNKS